MKKKTLMSVLSAVTFIVMFSGEVFADSLKLDVKEHVLKNGLKLLMLEKHDVPIIAVRIDY